MVEIFLNDFFNQYGATILYIILMAIISYIGLIVKKIIKKNYEDKVKKEVVQVVVIAIEQLYSELSGEEKLKKAIENATEMLEDRNIFINDLELRMIIESSVNSFNKHKKKM